MCHSSGCRVLPPNGDRTSTRSHPTARSAFSLRRYPPSMNRSLPMPKGGTPKPLAVLEATASTRSTPLWRSKTTGSPVRASTAVMRIARSGHRLLGSLAATVARHRACPDPSEAASISSAAAPILRRMSAASLAAAMIRFVLSMWSMTGPTGGCPPLGPSGRPWCGDAASRMAVSSSVGEALVTWAVAVAPADVPMIRSASVTSTPALDRPAMTPISHAFPADPPP